MKKSIEEKRIEEEAAEQLRINPVAAAERYRSKLSAAVDEKLHLLNKAVGDTQINRTLLDALIAWRRYEGFSHDLEMATGRSIYRVMGGLYQRLGSEFLQSRCRTLRGASGPTAEQLPEAKEILKAVRGSVPPKPGPKIFEGEAEYQRHLRKNGLTEPRYEPTESALERRQRLSGGEV